MDTSFFTLVCGVLLLFISAVVNSTQIPCSKTGDIRETIDGTTSQCCRGNVEVKQDGKKCCYKSGEFYFESRTLCCGGKLINRSKDQSISCCNNNIIDAVKYICCMGQKIELPPGLSSKDAKCCANNVYNKSDQSCCGHQLYRKNPKVSCCGQHIFDTATHWCDPCDRKQPKAKYFINCGGKEISLLKHSCCSDVPNNVPYYSQVYQKNVHHGCCKDKPINITYEKCCHGGNVVPRHLGCCGKGSFNPKNELCCDGQVVMKDGQADACCSINPYNPRNQGCCNGKTVFNRTTDKCCRGYDGASIHDITTQCCGKNELEPDSVCCLRHFAVKKDSPEDNKCCHTGQMSGKSYNSEKKGCLGEVNIYTKGEDEPCGSILIKTKNEICCFGYRHQRGPDSQCCGISTFNKKKQICCASHVYERSEGRCCGNKVYPISELPESCRKNSEVPKSMRALFRVCGDKNYEIDEEICCDEKLYSRHEDDERSPQEFCRLLNKSENVPSITTFSTFSIVGIIISISVHFL